MVYVRSAVIAATGYGAPGHTLITDDGYATPLPAGAMHNGAELLDLIAGMTGPSATVIVPDPWFAVDAATLIARAGWSHTIPPDDVETVNGWSAWTTYYRPGKALHVGILPMMKQHQTPLFDLGDDPRTMSRRLYDFQRVLGVSYRMTPGVCGGALLKGMYDRIGHQAQPRWQAPMSDPDVRGIGDLTYERPFTAGEAGCRLVHGFDVHGAYMSAAAMADLAWAALEYRSRPPFDPATAGFWRVTVASLHAPKWSPLAPEIVPDTRYLEDQTVWLTTPIARFLVDQGARLDVLDAWLAGRVAGRLVPTRRVLRPWAEQIRDARKNLPLTVPDESDRAVMAATLKRVPNETIGLLNPTKGKGLILRPDWAWTTRDVNRVNLLRKLAYIGAKTGRWPVRIKTDAVYYASNAEPAECASSLGISLAASWGPGRWHYVGTAPAAMWLTPDLWPLPELDNTRINVITNEIRA